MERLFADHSQIEELIQDGEFNPGQALGIGMGFAFITDNFGQQSALGDRLQHETFSLPEGGELYLVTDGVWGDFDRNSKRNKQVLEEIDARMEARIRGGMSRFVAVNLAYGEFFQRIILRKAPKNPERRANYLVSNRLTFPGSEVEEHDNAGAAYTLVGARE